jgi:hypothetical protein
LIFHRHVAPARYSMGSFYRKEIGQSTSYWFTIVILLYTANSVDPSSKSGGEIKTVEENI